MLIFLPFMKLDFKTSKKLYGQFTKTRLKHQEKNRKCLVYQAFLVELFSV